ncbi:MAG: TIGR00269 family protein [Thermoplasmata archaeon]|nr:TIGR00269 family protein [Thermoplasmata archaeon]
MDAQERARFPRAKYQREVPALVNCSTCDEPAVVDQPYRGQHVCRSHFLSSVDDRIRSEFHRQLPRFSGGTVAVALSGGKDSAVALAAAHRYFARRSTVRLVAVTVDEGIDGYRSGTLEAAERLTARLGVEHRVVRAESELGMTTDRAAAELPDTVPCSFCGVWRRRLLNRAARDMEAEVLVLGFNLDDLAQTVLMNLVRGDLDRIGRMAPHRTRQPGLVPRIAPLAQIPEREVFLYARLTGLPFDHGECPHAGRAARNVFRDVLWQLEEALPGSRQALLRTREELLERVASTGRAGAPRSCRECGEASSGELCRSCTYLERVRLPMIPTAAP